MLVKDPLCPCQSGYEAFGLETDVPHGTIFDAYRRNLRKLGVNRATAFRRRLSVTRQRLVEDTMYHVLQEPGDETDFAMRAREGAIDGILARTPKTGTVIHTAAVMSLWWACALAREGAGARDMEKAWSMTVGLWTTLIHSAAFWNAWIARRVPVYGMEAPEIEYRRVAADIRRRIEEVGAEALEQAPPLVLERVHALMEFETSVVEAMDGVILPFLTRYEIACELPESAELAPGFARLCGGPDAIDGLAEKLHAAKPRRGRVPMMRWLAACERVLNMRLAVLPRVEPMLALTVCHRPLIALDCARETLPDSPENSDENVAIRYVAALASVELARAERSAGPDRINDIVDHIERCLLLIEKVREKAAAVPTPLRRLIERAAPGLGDEAVSLMVRSAIEAGQAFCKRCGNDEPRGATHAILVLEHVLTILEESAWKASAAEVAKNIAVFYVMRCNIHAKRGESMQAKQDLYTAGSFDPQNPFVLKVRGQHLE